MRSYHFALRSRLVLATLMGLALLGKVSLAHHSFAMFDFDKVVTLQATVKEFQWTNPHVILWVTVDGKDGQPAQPWSSELTSPGNLTRIGWSKRVFKEGDRIELELHPLRDGKPGGAFRKATILATGEVWVSNLRGQEKPGLK
jgi:hypothetical protein